MITKLLHTFSLVHYKTLAVQPTANKPKQISSLVNQQNTSITPHSSHLITSPSLALVVYSQNLTSPSLALVVYSQKPLLKHSLSFSHKENEDLNPIFKIKTRKFK